MKIFKLKNIYFLSIFIIILYSCNNEANDLIENQINENKLSPEEYFNILRIKPKGGRILLESNASTKFQNKYISTNISSFNRKNKSKNSFEIKNTKTKSLNSYNGNSDKNLKNLYGCTLEYKMTSSNQKSDEINDVYIPELLNVEINTNKFKAGTTITWNVDSLNTNGLILWYEYAPINQDKFDVINNNRKHKRGAITIEDTIGSYTITESDLANLPNNSFVTFTASRAGFDISQETGENQIAFIGVTSVSKVMRVEK